MSVLCNLIEMRAWHQTAFMQHIVNLRHKTNISIDHCDCFSCSRSFDCNKNAFMQDSYYAPCRSMLADLALFCFTSIQITFEIHSFELFVHRCTLNFEIGICICGHALRPYCNVIVLHLFHQSVFEFQIMLHIIKNITRLLLLQLREV